MSPGGTTVARALFAERSRWRWQETAFWVLAAASILAFPTHLVLISQVLILGLFAVSFDLLVGYAGIPSLGHAAFFGIGAYAAALLARAGWTEPLTGLLAAGAVAGIFGLIFSLFVGRLTGLALLMITFGVGLLLSAAGHSAKWLTGGDDGLSGITLSAIFGVFPFDFSGRIGAIYSYVVVLLAYLAVRRITNSPFGLQLKGIRENIRRVPALGISIPKRYMATFAISALVAGMAGGLLAQTTQTVALNVLSFERSASVLIMVMLGGMGSLIGALIGAAFYTIAQDRLSALSPVYWNFWIGLMLVLFVLFARGGFMGGLERLQRAIRKRTSSS
jgi:branched-chain amino acid transport system permease protein